MLRTALLIIILALPAPAHPHPGKTDRYGGHRCLQKCGDWGLFLEEYHLHDKEGRPVRVPENRNVPPEPTAPAEPAAEPAPVPAEEEPARKPAAQETVTVYRHLTVIQDEGIIPRNPLVFVLLVLLVLLLILRVGNSRKEKS